MASDNARTSRNRAGGNRLSTSIYEEIRGRICLLKYKPQLVLRESDLAEEFSISRTPVRQALQRLEIEGYVETRNGVGTIVTGIDIPAFQDVYAMRLQLASLIGKMTPNACDEKMAKALEALLARAEGLGSKRNADEFWKINLERHKVILSLIGNSALRELYDTFYFRTSRVWYLVIDEIWENQVQALCAELNDLVRAFRLGDPTSVANVEYNHLNYYLAIVRRFSSRAPGHFPKQC